jgi:hypothetical protein
LENGVLFLQIIFPDLSFKLKTGKPLLPYFRLYSGPIILSNELPKRQDLPSEFLVLSIKNDMPANSPLFVRGFL